MTGLGATTKGGRAQSGHTLRKAIASHYYGNTTAGEDCTGPSVHCDAGFLAYLNSYK